MLQNVLHVDAGDARALNLDPLLREAGVVYVSHIEMVAHPRAVDVVEKGMKFARTEEEALFGIAVLDPYLHFRLGGGFRQLFERIDAAIINLVVRNLARDNARHHENGVGLEDLRGFHLPLDVTESGRSQGGISRRNVLFPIERVCHIRYREAGVLNARKQSAQLRIGGLHLEPGAVAEPQLHAVIHGVFEQLQAVLKGHPLRKDVIADRLLHETMMLPLLALLVAATLASAADAPVTEVTPTVLVFATSNGNVVASVGPDGALLVGTPSAASTSQISEILANRTKNPIRYVVIAPEDLAHSEGDAGWGKRGAFVLMQEKALERLGGHAMGPMHPLPQRLVELGVDRPRVAFSEVITFDVNGDAIHVVHQAPGYSDADALVHFHMAHLLYFGELFPGDGYPELDPQQHGSLEGFIKVLGPWGNSKMRVVPARGQVTAAGDLKEFCNMLETVRDRVKKGIENGQTEDSIVAGHQTADFDVRWGHGRVAPDAFVREVYAALKAPQPKTTQP